MTILNSPTNTTSSKGVKEMASFQQLLTLVFISFFLLLPLCYLLIWRPKSNKTTKEAPEAPGAWPIIGHLLLLARGGALPHLTLAEMADSYGPVFTIRLGIRRALVVNDWEVAKECLSTNDKNFASRPSSLAIKLMGYDYAMFGFAPYGPYWRELRKIVVHDLLSKHRLQMLNHVWTSEIDIAIKELYQLWFNNVQSKGPGPVLVDMKQWCRDLTLNSAVKLVAGRRFPGITSGGDNDDETERCLEALREFMRLVGLFVVSDSLPFLRWMDLQGYEKEMKKTAKVLDYFVQGWLDEHKMKRKSGSTDQGDQDLMDAMLSLLEDSTVTEYDVDTINKANCLSLILGASDTTAVSLVWALSLLLDHPHIIQKAQAELDVHVGKDRHVDESDIKNLVYLQALVKESMRLCPASPLLPPHEAIEDCTVAGYNIPAGTQLIVNLWKMQRDPQLWSDPLEFRPERFLTQHADVDVRGQHFQLLPFGSGRRSCPGMPLAVHLVHLTLARLLQGFELATGSGSPVDMNGSPGLGNLKQTPLKVLLSPRLASKHF